MLIDAIDGSFIADPTDILGLPYLVFVELDEHFLLDDGPREHGIVAYAILPEMDAHRLYFRNRAYAYAFLDTVYDSETVH